jgi:hypothetical protein
MRDDRGGDGVLRWAAVAVPGIFAGIGWAAADGWPLLNRILAGIAAALVVYAAIHLLVRGVKQRKR